MEAAIVDCSRVRLLYAELLLSYPREVVSTWLRSIAADLAPDSDPAAFTETLWKSQGQIPLSWEMALLRSLDRWLLGQNCDPGAFADRAYKRFAEQPALSARHQLQAFKPFMPLFYSTHDQRQLLLKILSPLHEKGPADFKLVYQSVRYGWRRDLVLFQPRALAGDSYRTLDFNRWTLRELAYAPVSLGLPAYEETRLWTDLRDPSQILADAACAQTLPAASRISFYTFAKKCGFEFTLSELPDSEGLLFEQDFCDPRTGAILLKAGCLYGVPAALAEFRYQTVLGKSANPFERLVGHLVDPEYSLWKQVQERHELLLEELRAVVEIVYRHEDDSITVDNHHLMRNVPAKILRNVLREFAQNGRADFENREFKRDSEICMDPLNPNFEGRLKRVIEHLHRVPGVMDIERVRRGGFRFKAYKPLRYREEA